MTTTERRVTINHDQELYVTEADGGGHSCLGFDVCLRRIERILLEFTMRGLDTPESMATARGDLATYDTYMILMDMLRTEVERSGEKAICELSPQLVGLEGHRVEVVTAYGETRRFIVGESTGWMPCHLEIARRDSSGGGAAEFEYESVTDLGRARR